MRRLDRHRIEPEDEMVEPGFAPARPAPAVAALLRMQTTAGNQATGRILARAADAEAKAAQPAKDHVMTLSGMGDYVLTSFQWEGGKTVGVALEVTADMARLMRAAQTGEPIATVTIGVKGHTLRLTNVLIASFQESDSGGGAPLVTLQLNAESTEFK